MPSVTPKIKAIFATALEFPTVEERTAYLDGACGDDRQLRTEIESLLAVHAEADGFLSRAVPLAADTIDLGTATKPLGTQIGPYKLREQIGEGGMGVVYVAEQVEPVKRKVALKIIRPGMANSDVVARFEAERQALAVMEHPNIARVFDGGVTDVGHPYFVMELVQGLPISEYCDQHQLGTSERLELMEKVCRAVQHAHQKGVIHRDLKPSNVLVSEIDGAAVPKVIDFGVAKAVGLKLTENTVYTQFSQLVGTPLYMSPEQAGLGVVDIDTRSDVYSLGVLLYELLTGSTPFDSETLKSAGFDGMRRIIREDEPLKPSAMVSSLKAEALSTVSQRRGSDPRKLSDSLSSELDWLVMKALEKDRNRRYESASALAQDIGRYLAQKPIMAGPPSAVYRFRKFARRQKTALAIATVVTFALLIVLGTLGGSIGWAMRDRASRQIAIDAEVNLALNEATRLQAKQKYGEALSAAMRAESLLSSGSKPELRKLAGDLRKDLQMVLRLESIPLEGSRPNSEGGFDFAKEDEAYDAAFRQFGVDARVFTAPEIAGRTSATTIRLELASALDNWAFTRWYVRPEGDEIEQKLVAAARLADPDELRNRIRDAQATHDAKTLNELLTHESDGVMQWPTSRLLFAAFFQVDPEPLQSAQLMTLASRLHRRRPDDFWNNYMLAALHGSKQPPQWEDAARYYTAALALQPENAATQHDLARLLVYWPRPDVDHFAEAVDLAQKAVKAAPTAGTYWGTLGIAHYRAEQWVEAKTAFQETMKLRNGGNSLEWFYLAMIHEHLGETAQARQWYEQAVKWMEQNDPHHGELKSLRAEAAKLLNIKVGSPLETWLKQLIER